MLGYDHWVQRFKNKVRPPLFIIRALNHSQEQFACPICNYEGPFVDFHSFAGTRKHAVCPKCRSLERHRLQYLVVTAALKDMNSLEMKMLHFAPEKYLRPIFAKRFGSYETADLYMGGVDHRVDILSLPFRDGTYDFVFASHVLEHIADDQKAIAEIRRILKPKGLAILPVPVVCDKTIEYPEANPHEAGHVRAPGLDYYDKYKHYFSRVEIHASQSFPEKYQLFVYEDRSVWPTANCPLRPPMQGARHSDFVPVCYV
jgi:SAM-dependent methyltransferase